MRQLRADPCADEKTMFTHASPRTVAFRMLQAMYGALPSVKTALPSPLHLAQFQEDAVAIASAIISQRGGVIVADSVGLGKTYVALRLIEQAMRVGQTVFVLTPASLRRDWTRHLAALEETFATAGNADTSVRWMSHTRLSRMGYSAAAALRAKILRRPLVVVDEAHAFRSSATRRYRALASMCRDSDVVLVTATPVNNSLLDLYNLIRLFASDTALQDIGVPHLAGLFRQHVAEGRDSSALRTVVGALVVRRTRSFVKQHYNGTGNNTAQLRFPAAAPPVPLPYAISARATDGRTLLGIIRTLSLAPYRLLTPALHAPRGFSTELVRFHLLKRLESSVAALHASIVRLLAFYESFASNLRDGRMAPLHASSTARGDPLQLSLEAILTVPVPRHVDVQALLFECATDMKNLVKAASLAAGMVANDPKLAQVKELLYGRLHGRKVVLFAEYRDTADYLWRNLVLGGRVGHIDGAEAHLGQSRATRRMVVERFAPRSNHVRDPLAHERVDLLIATDVLSEGINLQDASAVISYDLPWNPVRLIQRVGRVDRLGSDHEWVGSYHFVPDEMLDEMLGLMKKLRRKVRAIRTSVGAESSVLGPDPTRVIEDLQQGDISAFARAETSTLDNTAEERLRALYLQLARTQVTPLTSASDNDRTCLVCEIHAPGIAHDHWLVTYVHGDVAHRVIVEDGAVRPADEQAGRLLEKLLTEEQTGLASELSGHFESVACMVRNYAARQTHAPPGESAGRLVGRLAALAASLPGGPTDAQCRRIDAVRDILQRWPEAAVQTLLADVQRRSRELSPAQQLEATLRSIETNAPASSANMKDQNGLRILAMIRKTAPTIALLVR